MDENKLNKIDGLKNCVSLKSLYISHNKIKTISGLESLVNLETLWLCNNKIEVKTEKTINFQIYIYFNILKIQILYEMRKL